MTRMKVSAAPDQKGGAGDVQAPMGNEEQALINSSFSAVDISVPVPSTSPFDATRKAKLARKRARAEARALERIVPVLREYGGELTLHCLARRVRVPIVVVRGTVHQMAAEGLLEVKQIDAARIMIRLAPGEKKEAKP